MLDPVDFGFKNEYYLDLADTFIMFQQSPSLFEKSECYYNAYTLLDNLEEHKDGDRIVYGYVLSTDGKRKVAVRHSWNELDGRKIDVSILANEENVISMMNYKYLPVDTYTFSLYRDLMIKYDRYGLPETRKERKIVNSLIEKGFEVLGYEQG